jgi:hypothetical protein
MSINNIKNPELTLVPDHLIEIGKNNKDFLEEITKLMKLYLSFLAID